MHGRFQHTDLLCALLELYVGISFWEGEQGWYNVLDFSFPNCSQMSYSYYTHVSWKVNSARLQDIMGFPGVLMVKNLSANVGDERDIDLGLTPGLGRSRGGGHGNPLLYSCLEKTTDRGAWQAMAQDRFRQVQAGSGHN